MKATSTSLLILASLCSLCQAYPTRFYNANQTTLVLVHVLYRHGDRNPDVTSLYPSNPYYEEHNYYPYGYGQLTNEGKMREYKVGSALRQRYNVFLGKVWNISAIAVRSTDYDRTRMSASLMTAGLWPPSCINVWNPVLRWQPIPYKYEKASNDKELSPFLGCPTFNPLVDKLLNETAVGAYLAQRYNETLSILAEKTGETITYLKAFLLYFGFAIQEELNLPLEEWVSSVYPEPLHSLTIDYYYVETNTTQLRRIISGYLLKKILNDTQQKIEGTLSPEGRKMFVYSAHETNLAALLLSLDAYQVTDLPTYGSYILLEVHNIDGVYGIKIFYQNYKDDEPEGPLIIPGCEEFCPLDTFASLISDILPESDEECYGNSR